MQKQPIIVQLIIWFIIGGFCFYIFIVFLLCKLDSSEYQFITEQGEQLEIRLYKGNTQVVTIADLSVQVEVENFALFFKEDTFKNPEEIAKENFRFLREENGCHYYEIGGEEYVAYTSYSPHIITQDGHLYQFRFINTYDLLHSRYTGWKLFLVEYDYQDGKIGSANAVFTIRTFSSEPHVSVAELVDSIKQPVENLADLERLLAKSPLLKETN